MLNLLPVNIYTASLIDKPRFKGFMQIYQLQVGNITVLSGFRLAIMTFPVNRQRMTRKRRIKTWWAFTLIIFLL